ncbi:hypothetical protein ACNKHK_06265 [Shigella flexneri]
MAKASGMIALFMKSAVRVIINYTSTAFHIDCPDRAAFVNVDGARHPPTIQLDAFTAKDRVDLTISRWKSRASR